MLTPSRLHDRAGTRPRVGFTLIELLVSIAVLGLLAAFLVPAIQHVRETSRRVTCEQNLHEIGVAILNCESRRGYVETLYDPWWELLPDLGQGQLAAQLKAGDASARGSYGLDVLGCPTDEWADTGWAMLSYNFNAGTRFDPLLTDGFMATKEGDTNARGRRMWREITDGASNSVMVAERLVDRRPNVEVTLADEATGDRLRFLRFVPQMFDPVGEGRELVALCQSAGAPASLIVAPWSQASFGSIEGYDHLQPPNRWGCWNGPESGHPIGTRWAAVPATSLHPGMINALLCDGAVRLASENVDANVWRAAGSIDGAEFSPLF